MLDIATSTYAVFSLLVVTCVALYVRLHRMPTKVASTISNDANFGRFQRNYFTAYFLALFSDWLQGPYVYKLYSSYGFADSQIALLYVAGFASSAVFGTFTGLLADRCGRRNTSLTFCIVYAVCCLTKISPNFYVLLLGRLLGGIGTSMLFSTFEAWYVHEHVERHGFDAEWMSVTFTRATFWNGLLAIVAGVLANMVAESLAFGPVAPFLLAVPVLLVSFAVIAFTWDENYGNRQRDVAQSCLQGLRQVLFDDLVLMLGAVQALFEAVMYIFVFVWTPILDVGGGHHAPLGMIFAAFMVSVMIGSQVYQMMTTSSLPRSPETLLQAATVLGFVSMGLCYVATWNPTDRPNVPLAYVAFLLLEVAIGVYFPAIGYLRSKVIPEGHRAAIMNWFRLPMNGVTCVGLLWLHREGNDRRGNQVFAVCVAMMLLASALTFRFVGRLVQKRRGKLDSDAGTEDAPPAGN